MITSSDWRYRICPLIASIRWTVSTDSLSALVMAPSGGPEMTKMALGFKYFNFRLRSPSTCTVTVINNSSVRVYPRDQLLCSLLESKCYALA